MNTITIANPLASRTLARPVSFVLTQVMTQLVLGLQALDTLLRDRPARLGAERAEMLRMAEAYERTQPSYAADLRAAALMGGDLQ